MTDMYGGGRRNQEPGNPYHQQLDEMGNRVYTDSAPVPNAGQYNYNPNQNVNANPGGYPNGKTFIRP